MTVKRQAHKNVNTASWLFGHPVLRADNNSTARWVTKTTSPYYQKGGGWLAELNGGVQTGDDWAAIFIPVNEFPVHMFDAASWSYYMTTTDSYGVNIVIWAHDAEDFDKRVEITQLGSNSTIAKAAGWNAHKFNPATTQMFYFGENVPNLTQLTAGTQYTWEQFQADPLFKDWLIYRVSIEFGWQQSGTFGVASVAEVKLNEVPIPLVPAVQDAPRPDLVREITTTQAVAAAENYGVNDVICNNATTGIPWNFAEVVGHNGGSGYITKAQITVETTGQAHRLTLFLFSQTPTSELDDNKVNTGPADADRGFYLGKIDFPALESLGAGNSDTLAATSSPTSGIPFGFTCAVADVDLYGILVTRDAFTNETATDDYVITLTIEQA